MKAIEATLTVWSEDGDRDRYYSVLVHGMTPSVVCRLLLDYIKCGSLPCTDQQKQWVRTVLGHWIESGYEDYGVKLKAADGRVTLAKLSAYRFEVHE